MNKNGPLKKNTNKIKLTDAQAEDIRFSGVLGGEISNDLGFGTLEQAKDWLDKKYPPWNQEELDMLRERLKKAKKAKY